MTGLRIKSTFSGSPELFLDNFRTAFVERFYVSDAAEYTLVMSYHIRLERMEYSLAKDTVTQHGTERLESYDRQADS